MSRLVIARKRSPLSAAAALLALCLLLVLRAGPAAAVDVTPTGPTEILTAGFLHTCGLTPAGAANCWGRDVEGQAGGAAEHPGPYTQVSAGAYHTCALTPAGAADCWGYDFHGQAGGAAEHPGPYTQLAAGYYHTCGLTPEGAADCWGSDAEGQAGDATEHPGPYTQLVAGNNHTCALTPAGAADCWGYDFYGQAGDVTEHPGPYTQLAAGVAHNCGLTPAGAADCWGFDSNGQAGDATEHPGPYTQLAAGNLHTCGLTPAGAADCWGRDDEGQAGGAAEHPGPYTQLAAGIYHTCGLTPAGAADCWGSNSSGQAADQSGPYGPYSPATGGEITVEKVVDGTTPGADWAFNGSPDIGNFPLPAAGGDETFGDLGAGDYTISETDIGGWVPSVSCTPGGETGDNSVTVTLADGDAVICTFTNTLCLAGTYDNGTACVDADPGYYVPTDGATAQIECWLGTYSSSPGAIECVAADPGHYAKQSPADGQVECDPGTYQPDSNGYFCYRADEGYKVPNSGATQQTACEPGEYQNEEEQDFCKTAPPGTYTDNYASVLPTSCSSGTYQPDWGRTFCYDADPGNYVPNTGSAQQNPCTAGTVQPDQGQTSCRGAYPGNYAPDQGMANELPCEPGTYQDEHGQIACKLAPAGTYAPDYGMTAPLDCPDGFTSDEGATECYAEPPTADLTIVKSVTGTGAPADWSFAYYGSFGDFSLTDEDPDKTENMVTPGTIVIIETNPSGYTTTASCDNGDSATDGNLALTLNAGDDVTCTFTNAICQPGNFDTNPSWACVPADPGHFVAIVGAIEQSACAPGNYQPNGGAIQCIQADPGYFVGDSAATAQAACDPGTYQPDSGGSGCIYADAGYYATGPAATAQEQCPPGTTSPLGSDSIDDCVAIPPTTADLTITKVISGTGAPADWSFTFTGDLGGFSLTDEDPDKANIGLTPGTFAVNETNPSGYTTTASCDNGDSSSSGALSVSLDNGDDVECTFTNTICQPGYFDNNTGWACVATEPGSFVDTVGASGPQFCAPGYYQSNYAAVACNEASPGYYAPGPAATVQTACPSGTTSPAGSDSVDDCVPTTGGLTNVFMSANAAGTTSGWLAFGSEDILKWDGIAWSIWFDGSAEGLTSVKAKHNINAFWIPDMSGDDFVFSFAQNRRTVPGIGHPVDGMDLVKWNGHIFSFFFDGSDIGLTNKTEEKIDALHILDGSESPVGAGCLAYLLISTQGPGKVPNHSGGVLKFGGEDVLGFCATSLGETTTGLWHMVIDGSAESMPRNSTDSISVSEDGGTLYLTTQGVFNVDAAAGGHSMVYEYDFGAGTFSGHIFSAPAKGLPGKVDGLQMN